jgi:hypothetical protein
MTLTQKWVEAADSERAFNAKPYIFPMGAKSYIGNTTVCSPINVDIAATACVTHHLNTERYMQLNIYAEENKERKGHDVKAQQLS